MKYQKHCQCCGHTITAYTHKLNKPLVRALKQLVDFYEVSRRPANLQKHLDLTKNQYNNFQKLQYFKLVQHTKEGWLPTLKAIEFIYNRVRIRDNAITFGKDILDYEHEAWRFKNVRYNYITILEIDVLSYKKREEYQDEKRDKLL